MTLSDTQRAAIRKEFEAFLRRRIAAVSSRIPDSDELNPFLTAVLGPRLMADMRVHQAFERGVVTSFGGTLQRVARIVAGQASGSGTGGADLEMTEHERRYFVQIKSGPKTANKDIAEKISDKLNSARARYGAGATGVLGVCFGTLDQVNPIARPEFENRGIEIWIGRDFWTRISQGEASTYDEILDLASEASVVGSDLQRVFDLKVSEMSVAFEQADDEDS